MHPENREYTYFPSVHHTYFRIDFFQIQHKDLALVVSSQIDYISFSDHAPIHVTLSWEAEPCTPPTWKLNKSLLQIPEVHSEVEKTLINYFTESVDPSLNSMIIWEEHKCMARGELIRVGALKKTGKSQADRFAGVPGALSRAAT